MAVQMILHNIRSAHNVGALFRSADAFGVSRIWLTGYTARPVDRHGRARRDIAKTALGAEGCIPWTPRSRADAACRFVRDHGFSLVAVEQDERATNLPVWSPPRDVCLIVGNEVTGVSPSLLHRADGIVEIPLIGAKESLNVGVAAGIALYHVVSASN